ncbi:MAG: hypothetical protein L3J03_10950 [Desulfobacterales bacterium]|nr:hypothetical protein [Desulfobacterales bacterium]
MGLTDKGAWTGWRCWLYGAVLLAGLCLVRPAVWAEEAGPAGVAPDDSDSSKAAALFGDDDDGFVYVRKGRHDPFMPMEQIIVDQGGPGSGEILTGMRRFEPGQLRLVAIVLREDKRYVAMVEDSTGKGYLLQPGTKIGRAGVVEKIAPNLVVVKQTLYTLAGDLRYNEVEMVMKTQGEDEE